MNKKLIGAVLGSFVIAAPAFAADKSAPATAKKEEKKMDAAKGGEKSCGGEKGCQGKMEAKDGKMDAKGGKMDAAKGGEKSCGGEKGCHAKK